MLPLFTLVLSSTSWPATGESLPEYTGLSLGRTGVLPKAKIACVLLPGLQGLPCVWSFCFLLSPAVPNYGVEGWGYCLFPTCNASSMCFFMPFWCSTTSFLISNVLSFLKTWFILHHPDSSYSWSHTGNF